MKRRKLLKGIAGVGATVAVAAVWPGWLREAFGAEVCPPAAAGHGGAATLVERALKQARAGGKPLLVLLVPEDYGARFRRGEWFGAWLNCGTAAQVAPLALA